MLLRADRFHAHKHPNPAGDRRLAGSCHVIHRLPDRRFDGFLCLVHVWVTVRLLDRLQQLRPVRSLQIIALSCPLQPWICLLCLSFLDGFPACFLDVGPTLHRSAAHLIPQRLSRCYCRLTFPCSFGLAYLEILRSATAGEKSLAMNLLGRLVEPRVDVIFLGLPRTALC